MKCSRLQSSAYPSTADSWDRPGAWFLIWQVSLLIYQIPPGHIPADTCWYVQDLQELSRHILLRRAARMSVEACTLGREKAELLSLHKDRRSGLTMLFCICNAEVKVHSQHWPAYSFPLACRALTDSLDSCLAFTQKHDITMWLTFERR